MKVFISWSGELSKKVAQELKRWVPCIIQSVEVFYSPDDIEKGENWDSKISTQLSECNYGIVCLTAENTSAPWINFEAGAIAKTLESRVSALMVDIKTSEIQGPLKRYQATKLEKEDMLQLLSDINKATDNPLATDVLDSTFNAIWDSMYSAISEAVNDYAPEKQEARKEENTNNDEAVEEILQLVRKQNVLLSTPEQLIPPHYFAELHQRYGRSDRDEIVYDQLLICTDTLLRNLHNIKDEYNNEKLRFILHELQIDNFLDIIIHMLLNQEHMNPKIRKRSLMIREKYNECREFFR